MFRRRSLNTKVMKTNDRKEFSSLNNSRNVSKLYYEGNIDEALKLIIREFVSDPRILLLIE